MKKLAVSLGALALTGCATLQPQQAVSQLDVRAEKYDTQECRAARQVALTYDDNVAARVGIGLGLGLFLGPFGLPFAIAADVHQTQKRDAVLAELKRHCEGQLSTAYKSPAGKSDLQVKIELLDDLKAKGLISESDHADRKSRLIDAAIEARPADLQQAAPAAAVPVMQHVVSPAASSGRVRNTGRTGCDMGVPGTC